MRCWPLALSLLVAAPAAADEIASFSPSDVTVGTELTILGDFSGIAAAGKGTRVFGIRGDATRAIAFEVLPVSATEIHAVARRFPRRRADPSVGKSWRLVVVPPAGAGVPLEAPGTFMTVGPELIDVGAASGVPGATLELLADNVGTGKLVVLIGNRKAKQIHAAGAPITLPPGVPGTPLTVIVPNLPSGPHPVSLRNAIGPSPAPIAFEVLP